MLGFRHREQVWAAIQHHSRAQVCGAEEQVSQGQPRTPWQWEAGGSPCHTVACFLRGQQRTSRCPHSGARPVLGGLPYKVVLKAFFFSPKQMCTAHLLSARYSPGPGEHRINPTKPTACQGLCLVAQGEELVNKPIPHKEMTLTIKVHSTCHQVSLPV